MPRPSPYTTEQAALIVSEYTDGSSMHELVRRYGGSRSTVLSRLLAAGVPLRTRVERQHRFPCRDDAFAGAETDAEAAYWVGMLMGDGCISVTKHSTWVILALAEQDASHVAKLRSFLAAEHRIMIQHYPGFPNRQPSHRLAVASKRLASDLSRYGVVPRKSKTAEVHLLEKNRHFWRGVIDSDGSLGSRRRKESHTPSPIVQAVGSETLMRQLASFTQELTGTTSQPHAANGCWAFAVHAGAAAELISHLYTDCTVALDRKWRIAMDLLRDWELRPRARAFDGKRAIGGAHARGRQGPSGVSRPAPRPAGP